MSDPLKTLLSELENSGLSMLQDANEHFKQAAKLLATPPARYFEIRTRADDKPVAVLPAESIVIAVGNVGSSSIQGATRQAECFLLPTGNALPTDLFYAEPLPVLPDRFLRGEG